MHQRHVRKTNWEETGNNSQFVYPVASDLSALLLLLLFGRSRLVVVG